MSVPAAIVVIYQGKVFPITTDASQGQLCHVYKDVRTAEAAAAKHPLCQAGYAKVIAVPGATPSQEPSEI